MNRILSTFIVKATNYPSFLKENKWLSIFMVVSMFLMIGVEFASAGTITPFVVFSMISSISGAWYVLNVNYKNDAMYLFGAIFALTYGIIAFKFMLYGDFFTNIFITLPICLHSLYKKLDTRYGLAKAIYNVQKLSVNGLPYYRIVLNDKKLMFITYFFLLSIGIIVLIMLGDPQPIKDAFTSISTLFGMGLMSLQRKEQWYFWIATNAVSIAIWAVNFITLGLNPSLIFMWGFYFINSIVAYVRWTKEEKKEEVN